MPPRAVGASGGETVTGSTCLRWLRTVLAGVVVAGAMHPAQAQAPASTTLADSQNQSSSGLLAQVRQRVVDAPVVRGQFEQLKTVKGFKQPLRSSGAFVAARGRGIVWHVQQPFESLLIVKPDSLQSRRADGAVAMQLNATDEPVLRTVNAMLFAVMAADLSQLEQHFEISGQASAAGWKLRLVPRDAMLVQWLKEVELQGQQFVQEVRLQEARGDSSLIRIQGAKSERVLSVEDAARLN